jgi:hypothetical protein
MAFRIRAALMTALAASSGAPCAWAQPAPATEQRVQGVQRVFPLPLEAEVAARQPVQCDLVPEFMPRSLWNTNLWPGGNVYYEFDANVTQPNRDAMRLAMDELETVAHIAFIPRTTQSNYIHAQNSTGNNSLIGMNGGSQTVNIYNWDYQYIMEHELMHALGVWHEQSRSDRATYVTVNYANIQPAYSHNYDIAAGAVSNGPFDFESIMLYDACAFSTCCAAGFTCSCATSCAAMQALPAYAQYQNVMGNRSYLSAGDKAGLVSRYGLPTDDTFEPNNSLAAARPISTGTYNLRLIDSDDYFSIAVAATSTLVITDTHPEADVDLALSLYTSAGTQLQTANTGTGTETITRTVSPGTYIIRVQKLARWGAAYTLSVTGCNAPTVSADPVATTACLGGSFQFTGAATDPGSAPFTFMWFQNGSSVVPGGRFTVTPGPSGRSSTLTVSGVVAGDAGQYTFTANNGCSTVTSSAAALTLTSPPQATIQAAQAKPCRWGSQTFTANPGAGGTFTYRWQMADDLNRTNWTDLSDGPVTIAGMANSATAAGATTSTLTLSNLALRGPDIADFRVVATGSCGPSTSTPLGVYVCGADFDCNGVVAVADIFAYLNAWFASDPRTDINGTPGLQVSDVFAFFSVWFTGCP